MIKESISRRIAGLDMHPGQVNGQYRYNTAIN